MQLDAHGRETYKLRLATTPPLSNWEASFDGGTTWHAGVPIDGEPDGYGWLLAGHLADPTGAVHVITSNNLPHVRAVSGGEIVARRRDVPPIEYDNN